MREQVDVAIIGAGQAGLALSWELTQGGREHVVLERGRVAQSWRSRWDSFTLVLPNWTVRLPGYPYTGDDPDGFLPRDQIVAHFERYVTSFDAPVREGVDVHSLERTGNSFQLLTSSGELEAREVVVASGGFQRGHRPEGLADVEVVTLDAYTSPGALPPGRVLVIGSGQSGCQVAEDLVLDGREVVLACGRAPWMPRRIGDRDVAGWLMDSPFMRMTVADLPSPMARFGANPQASGRDGGHDLHYRTLQGDGVTLAGHLLAVEDGVVHFAQDLDELIAFGDARYEDLRRMVAEMAADAGVPAPEMAPPPPFSAKAPAQLRLSDVAAIVLTTGFRPDYASWVKHSDAFDAMGYPLQRDGTSVVVPGLHFMGTHFQRCRASATLMGVAADARVLAGEMLAGRS